MKILWACGVWALGSLSLSAEGGAMEKVIAANSSEPHTSRFEESQRALNTLVSGMSSEDKKNLSTGFLFENLSYAFKAREEFPWAQEYSEEMFFNDVLPYAILDETRESWRPRFYEICKELVKDCETAGEAAQVLNRELFNKVNVHYNRGRKKPNQSPSESEESGKATCTGLSIILAYGCRSVGVPARVVGTALWADKSGNHTWVEIWDGEWKFLGADEYDAKGLNRGWFGGKASKAKEEEWQHAIWASSWGAQRNHFPMVWSRDDKSVGAVNVTARYVQKNPQSEKPKVGVRVFERAGGSRVVAEVSLLNAEGGVIESVMTQAGRADMNDVAQLNLPGKGPWTLLVKGGQVEQKVVLEEVPKQALDVVLDASAPAKQGIDLAPLVAAWKAEGKAKREQELKDQVIKIDDKEMKLLVRKFGEEPAGGHSLWISMHGGGGAPAAVNDRQWRNQIRLYEPEEGYFVAPRAPSDTWNLWHRPEIDPFFDRIISDFVICKGVNPERVYLMGYSAGGDGVYQVGPRMADRFAGAAMMAGHPNETKPDGLRNLPFEIFMGENDGAFKRNQIAEKWKGWLADKEKEDPEGYPHRVTIYPGLGHWMNGKDAEVLPRMIQLTREEWPKKVVWLQDDTTHERFYWLGVKAEGAKKARRLVGEVKGQTLSITGDDVSGLKFWLSDELVNLDEEVVVELNGKEAFRGIVERKPEVVAMSLRQRCGMVATALLVLE